MIPPEIVDRLNLRTEKKSYGESQVTGASCARFMDDPDIWVYDACPKGKIYHHPMYRIEKHTDEWLIKQLVPHDRIIKSVDDIKKRLIDQASPPIM